MRIISIHDDLVLVSQLVLLIRFFRPKTSHRFCTLFKPGPLLSCVSTLMSPEMTTLSYLVIILTVSSLVYCVRKNEGKILLFSAD